MQFSKRVLSDNVQLSARLDRLASELASGQANDFFSTQLVPETTPTQPTSIQEHICFHEVNNFQTLRPDEQIDDHIDMSTHSIEMPFEPTPSFYLNQIEELEYEKHVEEVVHVHKVCKVDDALTLRKDELSHNTSTGLNDV